jgi:predicted lipoprotein with Yx(FWY)xxD motif
MVHLHKFWQPRNWFLALAAIAVGGAIACGGSSSKATPTTAPAATQATSASSSAASAGAGTAAGASGSTGAAADGAASTLAITVGTGTLGTYLAGPNGHTLYVFLKDAPDKSNCSGGCLQTWPPLLQEEDDTVKADASATGKFGYIDTPAGEQVTYNGAPLYYFAADAQAGDTKGNLVNNIWFVARPESASTSVVGVRSSAGKTYLVGPTGMTLYLYAKDTDGVSNCSGACLQNWPALTVPQGLDPTAVSTASGALAVISRDDGSRQVTYKGLPVYYYAGDKLPGDTNGEGVGNVWSTAKP